MATVTIKLPDRAVVVYGPPGCGKTFNAERLRKHFGMLSLVDGWDGVELRNYTLHLTNHRPSCLPVWCLAYPFSSLSKVLE